MRYPHVEDGKNDSPTPLGNYSKLNWGREGHEDLLDKLKLKPK